MTFDPNHAAELNDAAINIFRISKIKKRIGGGPEAPELLKAFELFRCASGMAVRNDRPLQRISPILHYNFGCCCYYRNLWQSGQLNFYAAMRVAGIRGERSELERIEAFFYAFFGHVCSVIESWLTTGYAVDPAFFMESAPSNREPPWVLKPHPGMIRKCVAEFMARDSAASGKGNASVFFPIRSDADLL